MTQRIPEGQIVLIPDIQDDGFTQRIAENAPTHPMAAHDARDAITASRRDHQFVPNPNLEHSTQTPVAEEENGSLVTSPYRRIHVAQEVREASRERMRGLIEIVQSKNPELRD